MNLKKVEALEEEFDVFLSKLGKVDERRLSIAKELLTHGTEIGHGEGQTKVANWCIDLHDLVDQSQKLLQQVVDNIEHFIIILHENKESGENKYLLTKLMVLSQICINQIVALRKIRKKQTSIISYLVRFLNHLDNLVFRRWYFRQLKKLANLILKESHQVNQILKIEKRDSEEVKRIRDLLKNEKHKRLGAKGLVVVSWLTPGVGIALSISILKTFHYFNQLTQKYWGLRGLLS